MGAADPNLATLLVDHPFADDEGLLHSTDTTLTAGEVRRQVAELAARMRTAGAGPGRAVAVRLPNSPSVIVAMAALWSVGAVFVPVNPRLPSAEIDDVLGPTDPAVLVDADGIHQLAASRTYEQGTAFILWTSGTTGRPKPILHTHRGYLELLDRVLGPLRAGGPRRSAPTPNLIPVSLALNAGIYNALFGLRAGAALVVMDGFDTRTFAQLVRRFAIRSTVLPPTAMAMLNEDPDVTDLAPLRYVRSITAPLSPLQARRFTERFGTFVLNSYGQAEIGEVVGWTAADAREHPEKLGAAGRPHAGVAVKLAADDGGVVADGGIGRLLVRPPSMAAGYASGDELADRLDPEGFLDTGDLARLDPDGFVWIEGRSGDLINRGGNKVFPEEVEEVLRLSATVDDAAVVGVPDDRLGQVPVAFLVSDVEPDRTELDGLVRAHLVPYKVPVDYVRLDALPRNEVGKVLRSDLAAHYRP